MGTAHDPLGRNEATPGSLAQAIESYHHTHLEEILHYGKEYGEAAKRSLGGKATGMSIDGVWSLFATSVDIDSAQLALREVFFGAMEIMVAKDEGITSKLKLLDGTLNGDVSDEAST